MSLRDFAGAAFRAVTAVKDGPSLYDVCDPLFLTGDGGTTHLAKFYRTALANPPLRALLRRTGLPELRSETTVNTLRAALIEARDSETPDWASIGRPVAALLDTLTPSHPTPKRAAGPTALPALAEIDATIQTCAAHLLKSYARNG